MEEATASKRKDHLTAYLRKTNAGNSVDIHDRDVPIARLERIEVTGRGADPLAPRDAQGVLRSPHRPLSAVARKRREGLFNAPQAHEIRDALLADADSGSFCRLDLSPLVHRQAERLLLQAESAALRTLDALHLALAMHGSANYIVTYDTRMRAAAMHAGIKAIDL